VAHHQPAPRPAGDDRRRGLTVYGCEQDEARLFDELAPRFGVAPTTTSEVVSEASILSVPVNRCISVGHTSTVSKGELRALRAAGVEYVSTRSIGLDHIDLDAAAELGITVENVAYAPDGVADFTLMLILMAIRNATEVVGAAAHPDAKRGTGRGRDLRDMTVGVLGVGRIGRAVITRLKGFGCRVLACSNSPSTTPTAADFVPFDELLRESDIVTLHLPLTVETHHLIGRSELDSMKRGAFLVNTGRGSLVDTDALIAALQSGKFGGVALDVLEGEEERSRVGDATPPIEDPLLSRLRQLPNAIVTPHVAYRTARTLRETVEATLTNCVIFERNQADDEAQSRDLVRGLLGGA
jgi:D-specific alpha-keto acid dehydrogenase